MIKENRWLPFKTLKLLAPQAVRFGNKKTVSEEFWEYDLRY